MELHELAEQYVVPTAVANRLGIGPYELKRLCRAQRIKHLIRGWYAVWPPGDPRPPWEGATPWETALNRHRLLTTALVRSFNDRVAASHQSALVLAGGRLYGVDLETAHLARVGDTHSRHRRFAVIHPRADGPIRAGPTVCSRSRPRWQPSKWAWSPTAKWVLIEADGLGKYSDNLPPTPERVRAALAYQKKWEDDLRLERGDRAR